MSKKENSMTKQNAGARERERERERERQRERERERERERGASKEEMLCDCSEGNEEQQMRKVRFPQSY